SPVPMTPAPKNKADNIPDIRGPRFSTNFPMKAAENPSKKMAILKANEIWLVLQPNSLAIGFVNTLHAYAEPIQICMPTPDKAISQRFFTFSMLPLPNLCNRLQNTPKNLYSNPSCLQSYFRNTSSIQKYLKTNYHV